MKGFVMRLGSSRRAIRLPALRRPALSARELVSRYGAQTFFVSLFLIGAAVGAACAGGVDAGLFDRLDFLFVTNIRARLEMSAFGIFSSCFVSYFLFIFLLFLFSLSAWGFVSAPALSVFKGFSVGLSSALICSAYGFAGVGFFILIVLPGAVLFLFALVRYSCVCFRLSLRYARLTVFGHDSSPDLRPMLRRFLRESLFAFVFSACCAVADMLMWVVFADKFHFLQ